MHTTIAELALLFSVAAAIGLVARLLKQPMILAYLVVGGLISLFGVLPIATSPIYQTFGSFGVTFLLFLVGLEINVTILRKVGLAAVILGLGQIVLTFVGGVLIGLLLGFSSVTASYIAIALTFSSTIIVVKMLSERQDINSLYGKLSIGILLVQDVVAVVLLVILAGFQNGETIATASIIYTISKACLLFGFAYWLGRSVMPMIFQRIARSEELLFLTSLAWVFAVAAVVQALGFSVEIGGFIAGLALANSSTHYEIASRIRPLRDFFIALFFIFLGSTVVLSNLSGLTMPIVVFSLFVLIGNPLIVLVIMGIMGYHRRTSFMTGVTVAQISEFSLVLAAMGLRLGHIDNQTVTIITGVGVVTIGLSSYMVIYADQLYRFLGPLVAVFHRSSSPPEPLGTPLLHGSILLVGAHRIGRSIALSLPKKQLIILDSDPDVIAVLQKLKFHTLFGDCADYDLLQELPFRKLTLVIATMPNFDDTIQLLEYLRQHPARGKRRIVVRADNDLDAAELYRRGADYVLQPQLSSGQYLGKMIAKDRSKNVDILDQLRHHDQRLARATPLNH